MTIYVVSAGQNFSGLALEKFDQLKILSGAGAANIIVDYEADLYVNSGGVISGARIYSGGGDFVTGFATASIVSGGWEVVQGGLASDSAIFAGGTEFVIAGGKAAGAVLYEGAVQRVSGGIADDTTVGAGAVQIISAGSIASGTIVQSGGFEEVFAGGIASATQVDAGGTLIVFPGGVVSSAVIAPGGTVVSTGVVLNTQPASVTVFSGIAMDLAVGGGDADYVLAGGVTQFAAISSGGAEFVYSGGIVSATSVTAGGTETVSGGRAYATFVSGAFAGGHSLQNIIGGGIASLTFVGSGGAENISGGTAFATVLSGGAQFIEAGAASNTVITAGGYQFIAGGSAVSTSVIGGSENVSGGTAYATTAGAGGHVAAAFGGTLSGTSLAGTAYVGPGGNAIATTIANSGLLILAGGTATGTVIGSGGAEILSANAVFSVAVAEDFSTIIQAGGSELVGDKAVVSNVTIAGALGFISGGQASGGITFESGGQMFIDQAEMPAAVISGFTPGDTITFAALAANAEDRLTVNAGVVMISAGGSVYDLSFAGAGAAHFALGSNADGDLTLLENPPCFAAGTQILTPRGGVAVENLVVGERVIIHSGAEAPIIWIGRRRLNLACHPSPEQVRPIRIKADAFAEGVPDQDLFVSPDHALFLGGVLIPAKALLNNRNVIHAAMTHVTYYHVELTEHAVIFAENCPVESYLETGNRGSFENAPGAVTLHPDLAQTKRETQSCAPFTDAGPAVEAIASRLLRRHYAAQALRHNRFAANPKRLPL